MKYEKHDHEIRRPEMTYAPPGECLGYKYTVTVGSGDDQRTIEVRSGEPFSLMLQVGRVIGEGEGAIACNWVYTLWPRDWDEFVAMMKRMVNQGEGEA